MNNINFWEEIPFDFLPQQLNSNAPIAHVEKEIRELFGKINFENIEQNKVINKFVEIIKGNPRGLLYKKLITNLIQSTPFNFNFLPKKVKNQIAFFLNIKELKAASITSRTNKVFFDQRIAVWYNQHYKNFYTLYRIKSWNFIDEFFKANAPKFTRLEMSHSHYIKSITFSGLTSLNIGHTFDNAELTALNKLSSLKKLNFFYLKDGQHVDQYKGLAELDSLKFKDCKNLNLPKILEKCSKIKKLSLTTSVMIEADLNEEDMQRLAQSTHLTDLQAISLKWTKVKTIDPLLNTPISQLIRLKFKSVQIKTSVSFDHISSHFQKLTFKSIYSQNIDLTSLFQSPCLAHLKTLKLKYHSVAGIPDIAACSLAQLTHLSLSNNYINEQDLEIMAKWNLNLRKLDLSGNSCHFTKFSKGFNLLSNFSTLTSLNLRANFIKKEGLAHILPKEINTHLQTLDLTYNALYQDDVNLKLFATLQSLTTFKISNCFMRKNTLHQLLVHYLPSVQRLDLAINNWYPKETYECFDDVTLFPNLRLKLIH